jgi:hypothetical protein
MSASFYVPYLVENRMSEVVVTDNQLKKGYAE